MTRKIQRVEAVQRRTVRQSRTYVRTIAAIAFDGYATAHNRRTALTAPNITEASR